MAPSMTCTTANPKIISQGLGNPVWPITSRCALFLSATLYQSPASPAHICEDLRTYKPLPDKQLLFHLLVCALPCSSLPPIKSYFSFTLSQRCVMLTTLPHSHPYSKLLFPGRLTASAGEMFSPPHCEIKGQE